YIITSNYYISKQLASHVCVTMSPPTLSPLQILYNRTMVQLGICAFRQGMIKDAHNALLDIQSSGRAKELLGQGLLMRNMQERNAEQEKIEKRRQVIYNMTLLSILFQVPFHMHIPPFMAAHKFDARRRMISKQFHHQLRVGERQPILGPPESMREHVVAASKSMKMGDWRTCHSFIINEKMNSKVWDLFPETQCGREMLVRLVCQKSSFTHVAKHTLVKLTILPILDFGDVIYKIASNTLLGKLDIVYHSAIRFVTKAPYTTHHCDLCALVG
uniref:Eukaryotic translation initiation factor 3 subunit C N-terminal domain-containing protein n=1 Tax=Oncorhynchus kisutch TaxID=8019 RepID=A0A8C7GGK5_ONCKI